MSEWNYTKSRKFPNFIRCLNNIVQRYIKFKFLRIIARTTVLNVLDEKTRKRKMKSH